MAGPECGASSVPIITGVSPTASGAAFRIPGSRDAGQSGWGREWVGTGVGGDRGAACLFEQWFPGCRAWPSLLPPPH